MTLRYCPSCGNDIAGAYQHLASQTVAHCPHCDHQLWNNPTPVACAIILHEDKVLLVRNQGWPEKMFALVSGYLDYNELPEACIRREVKEETDLDAQAVRFLGHYPFTPKNQLLIGFEVVATGDIVLQTSELAEYKHVPIDKLKAWPMGTGPMVADWLAEHKSND